MSARRFVIIGNESLLVHCGEALRRAGHGVDAIVTTSPEIGAWAAGTGSRVLPGLAAFREATDLPPFDVLLSVGNLELIPGDVIARARVAEARGRLLAEGERADRGAACAHVV